MFQTDCKNNNKVGVTILKSDKTDFKSDRDKNHYIMIRGPVYQEDKVIGNIYVPNTGAHKHIKQKLRAKRRNKQ